MMYTAYYGSEIMEKKLKENNLYERVKSLGYIRYSKGKPCFRQDLFAGTGCFGFSDRINVHLLIKLNRQDLIK